MADIMTPALGESVTEATVARWTKKVGEAVKKDVLPSWPSCFVGATAGRRRLP